MSTYKVYNENLMGEGEFEEIEYYLLDDFEEVAEKYVEELARDDAFTKQDIFTENSDSVTLIVENQNGIKKKVKVTAHFEVLEYYTEIIGDLEGEE